MMTNVLVVSICCSESLISHSKMLKTLA